MPIGTEVVEIPRKYLPMAYLRKKKGLGTSLKVRHSWEKAKPIRAKGPSRRAIDP